ncbi:DUF2516 family protein [Streptomyces sp. NPDC001407]|uniref:DUF2516 family protein n=1 Tax=unclassified Streptomyces TaxID=2593676 RepID=UPI00340A942E
MLVDGFGSAIGWLAEWLPRVLCLFALAAVVDAATTREDAFRAADKQTKRFWITVMALAALVSGLPSARYLGGGWAALAGIFGGLGFLLILAALIATIVYYVEVRATLKRINGRRSWPKKGPRGGGRY